MIGKIENYAVAFCMWFIYVRKSDTRISKVSIIDFVDCFITITDWKLRLIDFNRLFPKKVKIGYIGTSGVFSEKYS